MNFGTRPRRVHLGKACCIGHWGVGVKGIHLMFMGQGGRVRTAFADSLAPESWIR